MRNFRRGFLFACQIKKKGFNPHEILEFGPGSGYFASAIRHVFPMARVTVVDIVDEVLSENIVTHGFEGIKGSPEEIAALDGRKFDLIIARDILEHVSNIGLVLKNISNLLNDNGLFHFLTPNGHEDGWKHYVTSQIYHEPSELLINHVNYFEGAGLLSCLIKNHLFPLKFYTYQLKTTFRGKGWSMNPAQAESITSHRSASAIISKNREIKKESNLEKQNILDRWYFKPGIKWMAYLYCWYMHEPRIKINPELNIGHEIYGLFIKKA